MLTIFAMTWQKGAKAQKDQKNDTYLWKLASQ